VTTSGPADGRPADVIGSGRDDERTSSWRRAAGTAVLVVLAVGALLLTRGGEDAPPPGDLQLLETGGGYTMQWGYGGRVDVTLPVVIRNDGPAVTVVSVALEGTSLAQPAVDVPLTGGGRLPLTLRQSMSCPEAALVPADAALLLEVRRGDTTQTRRMLLPDGAVEGLSAALAQLCAALPLAQALVLHAEETAVQGHEVQLLVRADNIGQTPLQLLSVDPATGFKATLTQPPGAPAVTLPFALADEPVVLALSVAIEDCDAVRSVVGLEQVGVADIAYTDGTGQRAVKAVMGDFAAMRELVEQLC
jgi:hypothetical protein